MHSYDNLKLTTASRIYRVPKRPPPVWSDPCLQAQVATLYIFLLASAQQRTLVQQRGKSRESNRRKHAQQRTRQPRTPSWHQPFRGRPRAARRRRCKCWPSKRGLALPRSRTQNGQAGRLPSQKAAPLPLTPRRTHHLPDLHNVVLGDRAQHHVLVRIPRKVRDLARVAAVNELPPASGLCPRLRTRVP